MRKYTLILSVFLLSFILLGFLSFNPQSASAANCAPGDLFSTTTGEPCANTNPSTGCLPGYLFSPITGKPCSGDVNPGFCRIVLNQELKLGSRGEAVRVFQQSLKDEGFLAGKVDGIYGPITNGASINYYRKCPTPIISGVSGPQSLNVNEVGTWTVTASSPNGGNLSYAVNWGDVFSITLCDPIPVGTVPGPCPQSSPASVFVQNSTFTHAYITPGIYKPTFTVTNSSGQSVQTSLSVNVGKVSNSSSIVVLSPNGGEAWAKGTTHTISWQDNTTWPPCPSNVGCMRPQRLYDIKLVQYQPPCIEVCTMLYPMPRTIANGVYGYSYDWTIPNCTASNPCSSNFEIPTGSYTIQVCQTGSSICDSSDNYFKITSGTTTSTPLIYSLSPSSGPVDTRVAIYGSGFTATGNRVKFGDLGSENNPSYSLNSSDGKTLVFTVPSSNYMACWYSQPACYAPAYMTQPGVYGVSVINANGTSKPVNFTVTNSTSTACEYPAPPSGYHYEGGQPYPTCGAYLVKDSNSQVY